MASDTLPKTMRTWTVQQAGPPATALHLTTDAPLPPAPGPAELLIRVSHVSLNPVDPHLVLTIPAWLPFRRRAVPGIDFAGEVVARGRDAPAGLSLGARVAGAVGLAYIVSGRGTLAEYLVLPATLVAEAPARMKAEESVGLLGVAGQTAFLVVKEAGLKGGERVLVNGASGGVGSVLVQLAKAKGAAVTGVCSGANESFVKGLGADEVVDYKAVQSLTEHLATKYREKPFDFIFDCVGDQGLYNHSPKYTTPKGQLISIVGGKSQGIVPFVRNKLIPTFLGGTPRTYKLLGVLPAGEYAREVATLVEKEEIKVAPIDSEFPMDQVPQAFEKINSKRTKGKIVIKVHT